MLGQGRSVKRCPRRREVEQEDEHQRLPQFGGVNLNLREAAGDQRTDAETAYHEAFEFLFTWQLTALLSNHRSNLRNQWRDGDHQRVREL